MRDGPHDTDRRAMFARLALNGTAFAFMGEVMATDARGSPALRETSNRGWYDVKDDFNARGDGETDDTHALQIAINTGSARVRPVLIPPGSYKITQSLTIPPNTMLVGSAPGLGFGCRIEPTGCPALVIGGPSQSFHCSIENLMIWPKGSAPACVISIDNSYSVVFRNIRIHEAQAGLKRAAVLLLGDPEAGGHGQCSNIIWDNLIVRNDSAQPSVAIFAAKGCGSHRFIAPDLENYRVLLEWQGGQIDLVTPYTERAGQYAVNCNISADDDTAYLNTFGGEIDSAKSGLGCAIRETTKNFNSFGTMWGETLDTAVFVYSIPIGPVTFYGMAANVSGIKRAKFSGVAGWRKSISFPQQTFGGSHQLEISIPAHGWNHVEVRVPGVRMKEYWARVSFNSDSQGAQISAFVSAENAVTIVGYNFSERQLNLRGLFTVECGLA